MSVFSLCWRRMVVVCDAASGHATTRTTITHRGELLACGGGVCQSLCLSVLVHLDGCSLAHRPALTGANIISVG